MRMFRALSVGLAASMLMAMPAMAQPMSAEDARAQLQQYCTETAQRTDEAGRAWYAANCTPEALARYDARVVPAGAGTAAVLFGLAALAAAIFH